MAEQYLKLKNFEDLINVALQVNLSVTNTV